MEQSSCTRPGPTGRAQESALPLDGPGLVRPRPLRSGTAPAATPTGGGAASDEGLADPDPMP